MRNPPLTFDEWAHAIGTHVLEAVPQASMKGKIDDVYRWRYAGRECQVHAISDGTATFITLECTRRVAVMRRPESVAIAEQTQADVAQRIIGWFRS